MSHMAKGKARNDYYYKVEPPHVRHQNVAKFNL